MAFFGKKEYEQDAGKKFSCNACGLLKYCQSPKMEPYGNFKKQILIVGDYPSAADDETGLPLQNRGGKFLKRVLAKHGIDLFEDCLVTFALKCHPKKKLTKKNIPSCRRFLQDVIKERQPKIIILMGKYAVESLIGSLWKKDLGGIDKWRGFTIPDQTYNAWICPIYSPNFVVSEDNDVVDVLWEKDISAALEKVHKKVPVTKEPEIEIVKDYNIKFLDDIRGGSIVAFDYETTGLKPHAEGHKILVASVADSKDHVWSFLMPQEVRYRKPFLRFLKNLSLDKIAHNKKFEDNWSNVILNVSVRQWSFDTQLAAHIIDNRPDITSLKFQTYVRLGIADYDSEISPILKAKTSNDFNKLEQFIETPENQDKALTYCGYDSIYTYRIAMQMMNEMDYDFLPF